MRGKMALLIDLPSPVEEDLAVVAKREGVSASEQATFLLELMTALTREGRKTPFRSAVKAFLQENAFDADRLAEVFEKLRAFCLNNSVPDSPTTDRAFSSSIELLHDWRSPAVHRSIDQEAENSKPGTTPAEASVQASGKKNRISALGKYAHINFSTEQFMAEKQAEIEREDRVR
jgi:hypothetical protein